MNEMRAICEAFGLENYQNLLRWDLVRIIERATRDAMLYGRSFPGFERFYFLSFFLSLMKSMYRYRILTQDQHEQLINTPWWWMENLEDLIKQIKQKVRKRFTCNTFTWLFLFFFSFLEIMIWKQTISLNVSLKV